MAGTTAPRRARRATVLENIFGSASALQAAEQQLKGMLRERGILFGDDLLPTCAFALVMAQDKVAHWAKQAELVIEAAELMTHQLIADSITEDTQSFGSDLRELIFVNPGYQRCCVICRPDGIPVGDDLRFVELNCDSPAMMMFVDMVTQCLLELDAFKQVRASVQTISSADRLLDTLLECYREYGGKAHPTIAIADWPGQKTRYEHQHLAAHFEARGYTTVVCDPRTFKLGANRKLCLADGREVHLVYRRALASEIIARRGEVEALLTAYQHGTVCMVNPLRSYAASAKSLLTHLGESDLPPELKPAAKLIPRTFLLDDPMTRKHVQTEPERWVLKKSEGHGGMHVLLPDVASERARREALSAAGREVWIAQEYLTVPRLSFPVASGSSVSWAEKFFNWNPFVFGGRYAGGLVRVSTTPLINITLGGGLLPTLATTPNAHR